MSFPLKGIQYTAFLGEDEQGDIYLVTGRHDESGKGSAEVQRFNNKLEYLGTIRLSDNLPLFAPNRSSAISKCSDIYWFLPQEDKLRIEVLFDQGK
jgi:hypothetical protein